MSRVHGIRRRDYSNSEELGLVRRLPLARDELHYEHHAPQSISGWQAELGHGPKWIRGRWRAPNTKYVGCWRTLADADDAIRHGL